MEGKLLTTHTISVNDYYEKNIKAKTFVDVPIYFFDIDVIEEDRFTISFESAGDCMVLKKILILAPNGRVISSNKNKTHINFNADTTGKYTVKYWISHTCENNMLDTSEDIANLHSENVQKDYLDENHAKYNLSIYSINELDSISQNNTKIRVYSMLGSKKEGALHKGDMIKEKCAGYTPVKGQSKG
jgi:hypothetical protein